MRREFILVLLGIITVSTISSFLSGYAEVKPTLYLLDTVLGQVDCGNFSYWQLSHTGPLLIELITVAGDADIYVADNVRPGYEVNQNNFSSTTCGLDVVNIPANFPRPIGLGVFGHWSHEVSDYRINVFLDMSAQHTEHRDTASVKSQQHVPDEIDRMVIDEKWTPPRKHEEEPKPRFLKLLNVLEMIFEMVIL